MGAPYEFELDSHDVDIDWKEGGIIGKTFSNSKTERYDATIDFEKFYKEFPKFLDDNKHIDLQDKLGRPKQMKKGIFFDGYSKRGIHPHPRMYRTRPGMMFEKKFYWNMLPNGNYELEIEWWAKAYLDDKKKGTYAGHGWVEVQIDIVCRDIEIVEVLDGNTKKKLYKGLWEHRNRFHYNNKIVPELFLKMPFVKNKGWLIKMIIERFYLHRIEMEAEWVDDYIKGYIGKYLRSHFLPDPS